MRVKICGITDLLSAQQAVESGADAIGFVFAESKRRITIETAANIASCLPDHILKIGVFVNESKEVLEKTFEEVGLTHLQLHGDESPEFCQSLNYPVIKAISIQSEADLEKISQYEHCDYLLLDSPAGKYRGGNGTIFNWNLLTNQFIDKNKIILAGGLTIENVSEACKLVKPAMVDVSSGVETNGVKDPEKIVLFIQQAKTGGKINDNLYTTR